MADRLEFRAVVDPRLNGRTTERATEAAEARERAYEESLMEDLASEWVLPIGMRPDQALRTDKIESIASIEQPIAATNKGYQMMLRMGWGGGGLGKGRKGIVEPVRGGLDRWNKAGGVGLQEQDEHYTDQENIVRKKLATEVEETEEDKAKREKLLEKELQIQQDVAEMVSVFKCELCNKQYKTVMEYDEHLNSYDHHHKKRLMEMKETLKAQNGETREDILKREQRRAEKEMAKFSQLCASASATHPATAPTATALPTEGREAIKIGFGGAKKQKAKGGLFGAKKPKLQAGLAAFAVDEDEDT